MTRSGRRTGKSRSRKYRNYKVHIHPSVHLPIIHLYLNVSNHYQSIQYIHPSVCLSIVLAKIYIIYPNYCMYVCVEALFSLDLQLCSVIEEKLRICRGTGRWNLATCQLLVQPHPENTPQGITLLSEAQEEGNISFSL